MALPTWVAGLFEPLSKVVDELHFSGEEKAKLKLEMFAAQTELARQTLEYEMRLADAQAKVITAEAQGDSWIQRSWRPVTMLLFGFIVGWNYVLSPLGSWVAKMFGGPEVPVLTITSEMWTLLSIGIGGYIGGRSVEKISDVIKEGWGKKEGQ